MISFSLVSILAIAGCALAGCTRTSNATLPSIASPIHYPANTTGSAALGGPIRSPGGPYLYDQEGRVVFFHGVNAVYKLPPYELYPAPGKRWDFTAADASLMASLGFNVVRLGITWKGLEPGTAQANDPAICTPGTPRDPGQFNQAVLDRYLGNVSRTVELLARFHIYTLLDMHQDVYNEAFDGEGAPNWAVCTNGVPSKDPPGRWSRNYATTAAGIAYRHFWKNDVVGDLQGEYDRVWTAVATYFRSNSWVLGYDPFNEPFSTSLVDIRDEVFDGQLQCFYTGTAFIGSPNHGAPAISCPPSDPASGLIPRILSADSNHLIFYEPDIYARHGAANFVGPMNFRNLVFNVHIYCSYRSGKTGNPTDIAACVSQEVRALKTRSEDRSELATPAQTGGSAWFVSEFGATSNPQLLNEITKQEDLFLVSWTYWSWKYYDDPTGSADEALVTYQGKLRSTALALARTYPEAVAGKPTSLLFDPTNGAFHLVYTPDHAIHAPTVVFVPTQIHYPDGYCARVTGGTVVSRPGSEFLEVKNAASGGPVSVTVIPGRCNAGG
ncbi:MAG TPA: cellulase family glycosylhydrolase [Acidimicrobiales bacterium]|nr:cellulase family glycosylhydrolase [Acidimicrobiales bacterium]